MLKIILAVLIVQIASGFCAKILAVFPLPSKSHQNVHDIIMLELVNRGHEVVMITPYPIKNPPKNLTQIDVNFMDINLKKQLNYNSFANKGPLQFYDHYMKTFSPIFEEALNMEAIQEILNGPDDQFDLLFLSFIPAGYGFAHKFKGVPVISVASFPVLFPHFGAPTHPILYDDWYKVDKYDLSLYQRMKVLYDHINYKWMAYNVIPTYQTNLLKYFGNDTPSMLESLTFKADLLFVYSSPLLFSPRPTVPAIINIEGIHLKEKKPLPEDLQGFLDSSTQGVVYMSLGSNVQSKNLDKKTLDVITSAFGELPYNVLWKFEADDLPGLPKNVLIKKWLPQQDLLGHKNIKAFIFQGGQQSLEEAIRDSVPLICIPFAADQKANAQKIEKKGLGVRLDIFTLTKEELKEAIMNVTAEPRYKENMQKLAELFADQPQSPMERAMWWTEYVLRHKGAKHLRSPAIDVTYAEYFMLDVIGFLLLVAAISVTVVVVVLRFLVKLILQSLARRSKLKKN